MEHAVDVLITTLIAVTLLTAASTQLFPPRLPDGLGWALLAFHGTLGGIFVLTALIEYDWVPTPLPHWFFWIIRVSVLISGVAFIVELVRAGAFRRRRDE